MCKQEKNKIKEQRNKIVANGPALEFDWRRGGGTAVPGSGRRGRGGGAFNGHPNDGGADMTLTPKPAIV